MGSLVHSPWTACLTTNWRGPGKPQMDGWPSHKKNILWYVLYVCIICIYTYILWLECVAALIRILLQSLGLNHIYIYYIYSRIYIYIYLPSKSFKIPRCLSMILNILAYFSIDVLFVAIGDSVTHAPSEIPALKILGGKSETSQRYFNSCWNGGMVKNSIISMGIRPYIW